MLLFIRDNFILVVHDIRDGAQLDPTLLTRPRFRLFLTLAEKYVSDPAVQDKLARAKKGEIVRLTAEQEKHIMEKVLAGIERDVNAGDVFMPDLYNALRAALVQRQLDGAVDGQRAARIKESASGIITSLNGALRAAGKAELLPLEQRDLETLLRDSLLKQESNVGEALDGLLKRYISDDAQRAEVVENVLDAVEKEIECHLCMSAAVISSYLPGTVGLLALMTTMVGAGLVYVIARFSAEQPVALPVLASPLSLPASSPHFSSLVAALNVDNAIAQRVRRIVLFSNPELRHTALTDYGSLQPSVVQRFVEEHPVGVTFTLLYKTLLRNCFGFRQLALNIFQKFFSAHLDVMLDNFV